MTERTTIEPPPWVNRPAFLVTDRSKVSLAGKPLIKLVRLSAVVQWLMVSKSLGFIPAVLATHEPLAGLADLELYLDDESGIARLVDAFDTFNLNDPKRVQQGNRLVYMNRDLPNGVTPGLSAALFFVRHVWGEGRFSEAVLCEKSWTGSFLAMPCKQAAALWGYGRLAGVMSAPKVDPGFKTKI